MLKDTQICVRQFSYCVEKQVRCIAAFTNSDFNMPFQCSYASVVAVTFGAHSFHSYAKTYVVQSCNLKKSPKLFVAL